MFDDDDFDSELLGGLQRHQNLKDNQENLRATEATRKEIAALRADLKKKEDAERAAPKCPYCAGAISAGVSKCRHCASDIKWCKVLSQFGSNKSYPLKVDEDPQDFLDQKLRELDARKRAKEARYRAEEERLKERDKKGRERERIEALERKSPMGAVTGAIGSLLFVVLFLWLLFRGDNETFLSYFPTLLGILFFGGCAVAGVNFTWCILAENKAKAMAMAVGITVNCPLCAQEMHVTPSPNEQVIQCMRCSENFVVPAVFV